MVKVSAKDKQRQRASEEAAALLEQRRLRELLEREVCVYAMFMCLLYEVVFV